MTDLVSRRELILGVGSTALLGALGQRDALALDFSSTFGAVVGSLGVGLFPGAAAALGGFETIRLIANGANLLGNLNNIVGPVKADMDTIASFVQHCSNALDEIEQLLGQLPASLSAAFDAATAKQAFANLQADGGTMVGYLQSKGSIVAQGSQIQGQCARMAREISMLNVMMPNDLQFMMQAVPGLMTWMQGYTAYNLLLDGSSRGVNPWDHQLVSLTVLPRISNLLGSISAQRASEADVASWLPLDSKFIYKFDGTSFSRTTTKFALKYSPGEIDGGYYYAIWPEGLTIPPYYPIAPSGFPSGPAAPPVSVPPPPKPGDLCYLMIDHGGIGFRSWILAPQKGLGPIFPGTPPDFLAAQSASYALPRLTTSALKDDVGVNQLTDGWQVFEHAVKVNLIEVDRSTWTTMSKLTP